MKPARSDIKTRFEVTREKAALFMKVNLEDPSNSVSLGAFYHRAKCRLLFPHLSEKQLADVWDDLSAADRAICHIAACETVCYARNLLAIEPPRTLNLEAELYL